MVYAGTEAKFTCTGTTDPEEVQNLEINWEKDGDPINYEAAQRFLSTHSSVKLSFSIFFMIYFYLEFSRTTWTTR